MAACTIPLCCSRALRLVTALLALGHGCGADFDIPGLGPRRPGDAEIAAMVRLFLDGTAA
jgi:hypothetical protein